MYKTDSAGGGGGKRAGRKRKPAAADGSSPSPSKGGASKKKKAVKSEEEEEKRLTRLRGSSQPIRARILRARSQRLYLIQKTDESQNQFLAQRFEVLGSTGNVYSVLISQTPNCTCPDFAKGNVCKHILFVYLKVLRVDPESHILYQTSLLQKELDEAFSRSPPESGLDNGVLANARTVQAYKIQTGQETEEEAAKEAVAAKAAAQDEVVEEEEEEECAICFDDIKTDGKEELVRCMTCRKKLHKDCFTRWKTTKVRSHEKITCVYCRSDWVELKAGSPAPVAKGVTIKDGGYVNLAALQGVSTERDESTYAEWYRNRRIRQEMMDYAYSYDDEY